MNNDFVQESLGDGECPDSQNYWIICVWSGGTECWKEASRVAANRTGKQDAVYLQSGQPDKPLHLHSRGFSH